MVSCHTHRALHDLLASDHEVARAINRNAEFWLITSFSLQSTLFIVLARILDHDDKVHSIYKVLNQTTAHPEFFTRQALRARKLSIPGTGPNPPWLDEYVRNAWEPTVQDLRALKKALAPHKAKFDDIYRPIRHQIAHLIFRDEAAITALYSRTLKTDIDEMLCFLHNLIEAIWEMAWNGHAPDLNGDKHGYAKRVRDITTRTETLLRSLQ
jgi:hypothetical protein